MSKIPFDIKFRPQIESGEFKVETRDGRKVRIICWDRKCNDYPYPIIALLEKESGEEDIISYTQNGQHVIGISNLPRDLFIVTPEPEMSEWELAIAKYRPPTDSKETIQRIAAELLSLARKQLKPEIDAEIEKAYKTADEVQYRKGREEALKDMPRWRYELGDMEYAGYGIIGGGVASKENPRVYLNGRSIDLYSLSKLPGFNGE